MKLITKTDIETWGAGYPAKGDLPTLISKLIRATTPMSTEVDFPSGAGVFSGGWDGVVVCSQKTAFVPEGISLWEFGTGKRIGTKIKSDADKRSGDSLGYKNEDCTYIFLTTRHVGKKAVMIKKIKDEGGWKDVKLYDSNNMEEWLDRAIGVRRFFATIIGKVRHEGFTFTEEFWTVWTKYKRFELPPSMITCGREIELKILEEFLSGEPNILAVLAPSRDEAIAFIIAAGKQFAEHTKEVFLSKSIIVDLVPDFKTILYNEEKLNIIANFDDQKQLYAAVLNNHHVLLPLGPGEKSAVNTIHLPKSDKDHLIISLIGMGLDEETARKTVREATPNLTILKKRLEFPLSKPDWLKKKNIRQLVPALLVGRWNEKHAGDRELLELLSGMPYAKYQLALKKWLAIENSPLIQIGETWRLTSPLDAWTELAGVITSADLQQLQNSFIDTFKDGNPEIDQSLTDNPPLFPTKEYKFSGWLREGLCQSLVIVALYGTSLEMPLEEEGQLWTDAIIASLMQDPTEAQWRSFDNNMPLIAEASPVQFLEAVLRSLSSKEQRVMAMFTDSHEGLFEKHFYTGLLWALEGLAWLPDHLYQSSLIFLKLVALDPGGRLLNRPINTLTEIFKPWHHQTLASFDERMAILKKIVGLEKNAGWVLLLRLLPQDHGIAHETSRLRWRMFNMSTTLDYSINETFKTHSFVVDLIIANFDNSEVRFCRLLEDAVNLSGHDRIKLLSFLTERLPQISLTGLNAWNTVRQILAHHRSHADLRWALHETALAPYQILFDTLSPATTIDRYTWLFNEHWPEFPDIHEQPELSHSHRRELHRVALDKKRIEAVNELIALCGVQKIFELSLEVKEPRILGDSLARSGIGEADEKTVLQQVTTGSANGFFLYTFIYTRSRSAKPNWGIEWYKKFFAAGWSAIALAKFLIPLPDSVELWDFVETTADLTKAEFWKEVQPNFYMLPDAEKETAIRFLLRYNRFLYALDATSHHYEALSTELIMEVLAKTASGQPEENGRLRSYDVELIFAELDKRGDTPKQELAKLEWSYVSILSSFDSIRTPVLLHEQMSSDPLFFNDLLKWGFVSDDESINESEQADTDQATRNNRALHAYDLLHSWKQIPGMRTDGSIDGELLNVWVDTVRELAGQSGRLPIADMQIGQVLAQYPETKARWPVKEIFDVLEAVNTKSILSNYSAAMYNKRGSSSRGPFDGGRIEKDHAAYFNGLAKQIQTSHPVVARVFLNLAKGYLQEARKMDERAERDRLEY